MADAGRSREVGHGKVSARHRQDLSRQSCAHLDGGRSWHAAKPSVRHWWLDNTAHWYWKYYQRVMRSWWRLGREREAGQRRVLASCGPGRGAARSCEWSSGHCDPRLRTSSAGPRGARGRGLARPSIDCGATVHAPPTSTLPGDLPLTITGRLLPAGFQRPE
ncbi:hypothetical protein E2C01_047681 [Portunus trituberculatus]|uniref:Uncharacterized protein n=1 Tax=Portunus trituberculatus TaxID=210409 RepID=A0A5B7G495_PORTR|nr:hypothetical protein [Portunus trituberculatus]